MKMGVWIIPWEVEMVPARALLWISVESIENCISWYEIFAKIETIQEDMVNLQHSKICNHICPGTAKSFKKSN
jgi:hypothetical protein